MLSLLTLRPLLQLLESDSLIVSILKIRMEHSEKVDVTLEEGSEQEWNSQLFSALLSSVQFSLPSFYTFDHILGTKKNILIKSERFYRQLSQTVVQNSK